MHSIVTFPWNLSCNLSTLSHTHAHTCAHTHGTRARARTHARTHTHTHTHTHSTRGIHRMWHYREISMFLHWLIDWLSRVFTSHSTQNRSFWRRFPKPSSWLGTEKTKPSTTKARIHQSKNVPQHKKTKARFRRFSRHQAWKWSGSILEGKD